MDFLQFASILGLLVLFVVQVLALLAVYAVILVTPLLLMYACARKLYPGISGLQPHYFVYCVKGTDRDSGS